MSEEKKPQNEPVKKPDQGKPQSGAPSDSAKGPRQARVAARGKAQLSFSG